MLINSLEHYKCKQMGEKTLVKSKLVASHNKELLETCEFQFIRFSWKRQLGERLRLVSNCVLLSNIHMFENQFYFPISLKIISASTKTSFAICTLSVISLFFVFKHQQSMKNKPTQLFFWPASFATKFFPFLECHPWNDLDVKSKMQKGYCNTLAILTYVYWVVN